MASGTIARSNGPFGWSGYGWRGSAAEMGRWLMEAPSRARRGTKSRREGRQVTTGHDGNGQVLIYTYAEVDDGDRPSDRACRRAGSGRRRSSMDQLCQGCIAQVRGEGEQQRGVGVVGVVWERGQTSWRLREGN